MLFYCCQMKKLFYLSLLILLSLPYSCSKDYDLSKVDKNISIGGEQFVFPLGNSTKMVPDSLLNISNIKELETDDFGNYFFKYTGSIAQKLSFTSLAQQMCLPNQEVTRTQTGTTIPTMTDIELDLITFPLALTFSGQDAYGFNYDLSSAKAEGLLRLDSVEFKPSRIAFAGSLSCQGVTSFPSGLEMGINFAKPARIRIDDPRKTGDVIKVTSTLSSYGKTQIQPVAFTVIDLTDPTNEFKYSEDITINSIMISIPDKAAYKAVMGKDMSFDLKLSIEGENSGVMVPEIAWCLVDRDSDAIDTNIKLTGVPDYMKNGVLDLEMPILGIDLTTNATVPVNVDAEITSLTGTTVTGSASASLLTDYVPTPYQEVTSQYILANEDIGATGYHFVQTDLRSLVHTVPDVVNLVVTPNTYYDSSDPTAQHVVYLTEDTDVDVDYTFTLPFVFGPDLKMEFRDTITNMPERLGEILTKRNISIIGDATSTFPADFVLKLNFLDENNNSLDMHSSESVVKGTDQQGTPVVTPYSLDVEKSNKAEAISKLELILQLKNGQSVSLTKTDYIQLSIQASVPGGVEFEIDKD